MISRGDSREISYFLATRDTVQKSRCVIAVLYWVISITAAAIFDDNRLMTNLLADDKHQLCYQAEKGLTSEDTIPMYQAFLEIFSRLDFQSKINSDEKACITVVAVSKREKLT